MTIKNYTLLVMFTSNPLMYNCNVLVALSFIALCSAHLTACSPSDSASRQTEGRANVAQAVPVTAPPAAVCGPGSLPETGIQGRISREDHESGRVRQGYNCNTELIGSHAVQMAIGTVAGYKVKRYIDRRGNECAYYDSTLIFLLNAVDGHGLGVQVLDMNNPTKPVKTTQLITPAMLSPHESLLLNESRGILAAVSSTVATGPGILDLYDISQDCRYPILRSSSPVALLGHESGMSPDGRTFFSATAFTPTLTVVDISNLSKPIPIAVIPIRSHGVSVSNDGNRAYISDGLFGARDGAFGASLTILDISEIQNRKTSPKAKTIHKFSWPSIAVPQNSIPVTINGRSLLIEFDEGSSSANQGQIEIGAGRIIDISDECRPRVISNLRLAIHQPEFAALRASDSGQAVPGGYSLHYCNVPTRIDPKIVACSGVLSGLRIFDISDPDNPKEVAYFNAPISPKIGLDQANYVMSSPAFAPERKEIWYTDAYSGFYAVRVTNGAWPD